MLAKTFFYLQVLAKKQGPTFKLITSELLRLKSRTFLVSSKSSNFFPGEKAKPRA